MGDIIARGQAFLAAKLKAHASRTVTYRRGASSVSVQATIGTSLLSVGDGAGGTRVVRTDRDYLIAAADLVLGGVAVTPVRGDVITDAAAPAGDYEVMPYEGEPCWRYADPTGYMLRIHTKGA